MKGGKISLVQGVQDTQSKKEPGMFERAFQGGVAQTKAGYEQARTATNPLELLRGGTKLAAGAINTALTPLAPITAPLGAGIEKIGEKIGDMPAVQEFAQTGVGQAVAGAAEDVGNLATIAGATAGIKPGMGVVSKVAPSLAKGAGRVLKGAGESAYGVTIAPEKSTATAMLKYDAKQPNLIGRVKNLVTGESVGEKPITEANTAARKGLVGTEYRIGVQSEQIAQNLWQSKVSPALEGVKGTVNMKTFFSEVEKQIKKIPELSKRTTRLEALEALKQDFKGVGKIKLPKLQGYKEGWAESVPEATYAGKPIGTALKDVKNMAASKAREIIYKYAKGDDVKQAYIDYGNLKSIAKSGIKSVIGDPASKSLTRNIWQVVMDKAITPVVTVGGKILYRTGEGLEFIGNKGAKKVGDIVEGKKVQVIPQDLLETETKIPVKNVTPKMKSVKIKHLPSEYTNKIKTIE